MCAISHTSAAAASAPNTPVTEAMAAMSSMRGRVVKSPSRSRAWETDTLNYVDVKTIMEDLTA